MRFAVVAAPFAALMLAALGLAGASLGGLDSAIRTGLWLSVVFLYLAFWFSAAGVVNTFRFGSTTNGIILFGLWVGLTGIAPSAIDLAARRIAPVPTRAQILNAEREGSLNTWEAGPTVLAALHRQRPEFRPSSDARDYDAWRAQITAVYMKELETAERILGERRRSLDHRIRWTRRLAFLSPAALASLSLNTIAGTGSEGMFSLRRQAETFVAESRQFFFPKILRGEALSERDYQQIPVFRYRHASGGERAKRTLPYITGLVAFALFATGILACRRSFC